MSCTEAAVTFLGLGLNTETFFLHWGSSLQHGAVWVAAPFLAGGQRAPV